MKVSLISSATALVVALTACGGGGAAAPAASAPVSSAAAKPASAAASPSAAASALAKPAASTAAAASGSAGASAGGKLTDLRITATGQDQLPFMAVLQVAIDKGWFKDAGLNVSLSTGGGGGNTIRAVTTGDADMTIGAPTASYLAATKESNLRIIGPWFQSDDFAWIGPNAVSGPSDLNGKTLGFSSAGSTTELLVKAIAAKVPGVKTVAVGAMGDNWAAAKSDKIFAGWSMHPYTNERETKDGAKIDVKAIDYVPDFVADMVMVNTDFAKKNPDAVTSFWKVAQKANDYVVNDTHNAAADIGKAIKTDADIVEAGLKATPDFKNAYNIKVNTKALNATADLMVKAGQVDKAPDWKTLIDQQYLPTEARTSF
ncbi:MAG: ABC transporter substrate-binding protein [Chloroflexota bacterium]